MNKRKLSRKSCRTLPASVRRTGTIVYGQREQRVLWRKAARACKSQLSPWAAEALTREARRVLEVANGRSS